MHKPDLRIIYMGTPEFAVFPLKKLIEAGFHIVGVVTNPDKPAGRGQQMQESAVKKYAREAGLTILQPEKFRDEIFLSELAALKADLQLVVAFKMLPEVVWNMPPLGTVNLHASLLPDYRGAAPINWAVINGEKVSGVTTFLLKHEIDTGNIIYREKVGIGESMTAGELHDLLMEKGADLLLKTVCSIEADHFPLTDQRGLLENREAIHAPKIFKEDMRIDWRNSIDKVYNHVRGLSPFPGAWTELHQNSTGMVLPLKVFQTEKIECQHDRKVGEIETDPGKTFDVFVQGGVIRILELQLSGKKKMYAEDFLRGFHLNEYHLEA